MNSIITKYLSKCIRKPRYSIVKEKVRVIIFVLKTGIPWKQLNHCNFKYSESNYRKFHSRLVNLGVIKEVLKEIPKTSKISYIDTSNIRNKHGEKETIGFNPQDKKHKGNKVSLIVNEKGKALNCCVDKGSCHDLKLFDKTIEGVKTKIIVGDKGYTSQKRKEELRKKGIKLLYPFKKNSKKVNSAKEKKILKKRHLVENAFSHLKKFKRIDSRYEVKLKYFVGFVELGVVLISV